MLQVSVKLQVLIKKIVKKSNNHTKLTVLKRAVRSNLLSQESSILSIKNVIFKLPLYYINIALVNFAFLVGITMN